MQSFRWQKIAEVPNKQSHDVTVLPPDTSKMQSSCWQKIAEVPNDDFEIPLEPSQVRLPYPRLCTRTATRVAPSEVSITSRADGSGRAPPSSSIPSIWRIIAHILRVSAPLGPLNGRRYEK